MGKFLGKILKCFNDWKWKILNNRDIEVLVGYPAYCDEYLTIYYNRVKNKWTFEWDDLFADPRPSKYPIHRCMMVIPLDTEATQEEISYAMTLLRQRGLSN